MVGSKAKKEERKGGSRREGGQNKAGKGRKIDRQGRAGYKGTRVRSPCIREGVRQGRKKGAEGRRLTEGRSEGKRGVYVAIHQRWSLVHHR